MERIGYQDVPEGTFEKLMAIEELINHSGLGMNLLELVRLRVAQINGCAYCVDMHYKELKHTGETELRMSSLSVWRDTNYFSEVEKTVLDFTEKLTVIGSEGISTEVFDNLLKHFGKSEISYLSLAISQINTWTRLMKTFRFTPGNYKVQE